MIPCRAGDFGINLYGLSYHFNRTTSDGRSFSEFNPGIGAKFVFLQSGRSKGFCEGGVFSDSERNSAKYAAFGYSYEVIDSLFSVGLTVGPYRSSTLNYNRVFVAFIPTVSVGYKWFNFHLVYLPAYKDVNRIPTLGLYATVYPFQF